MKTKSQVDVAMDNFLATHDPTKAGQLRSLAQGCAKDSIGPSDLTKAKQDERTPRTISSPAAAPALTQGSEQNLDASLSTYASGIAFEADTRWHGLHPANLKQEGSRCLDDIIPKGFRYARELQHEIAYIPPLNHPQAAPNAQFIVQKPGSSAVAIIRPRA